MASAEDEGARAVERIEHGEPLRGQNFGQERR